MESNVKKTWKPIVAGILEVVAGALVLIGCIFLIIGIIVAGGAFDIPGTGDIPSFVAPLISVVAIIVAAIGVLALLGGIYAVHKEEVVACTGWLNSFPRCIDAVGHCSYHLYSNI
jgi:hypothetical protein